jgi:hypothetical protein
MVHCTWIGPFKAFIAHELINGYMTIILAASLGIYSTPNQNVAKVWVPSHEDGGGSQFLSPAQTAAASWRGTKTSPPNILSRSRARGPFTTRRSPRIEAE